MFKSEFDRIGYRNGFIKQNYKCLSVPENTVKGKLKCLTFSPVSNKLYADYGKGSNVVFDDGRWSEIEEDNMERGYMHREVKYLLKKDGNTFSLNSVFGDKELDYKLCREKCESLFERFGYPNRLFTIEDLNFFFHVGKKVGRMGGSKDFEYYKEVFLGSLVVDVTGVDSKGFAILEVSDEMKSKCVQAV